MLTRDQIIKNIQAFEAQGASTFGVQYYLNGLKSVLSNQEMPMASEALESAQLLGKELGEKAQPIAESAIVGMKKIGEKAMEIINPGQSYVSPYLKKFGVPSLLAGGIGLGIDILTPGPGELARGAKVVKEAKPIFTGFKDLTTKFLDYAKGKTTLSKQEIIDFARRPELKRGEADLLNRLGSEIKEIKIPAQEFADSIRRDLLELKPVKVKEPQYSRTSIDESVFGQAGRGEIPQITKRGNVVGKNYEEVVYESPITTNGSPVHYPNSKNYFAHTRGDTVIENGEKIKRVQEIQADVLQKEGMEDAMPKIENTRRTAKDKEIIANRQEQFKKLQPFTNDRFGERIMREEIKRATQSGHTKLRLPTGETIGKIEGFVENRFFTTESFGKGIPMRLDEAKVGREIVTAADDHWVITDIIGEGRFKAVTKNIKEGLTRKAYWLDEGKDGWVYVMNETLGRPPKPMPSKAQAEAFIKAEIEKGYDNLAETFDLTGKSNPQYRRYEDWGKFLKNKFGGKEVIDPQGNKWMEIDLKKEYTRFPVEAFGVVPFMVDENNE